MDPKDYNRRPENFFTPHVPIDISRPKTLFPYNELNEN